MRGACEQAGLIERPAGAEAERFNGHACFVVFECDDSAGFGRNGLWQTRPYWASASGITPGYPNSHVAKPWKKQEVLNPKILQTVRLLWDQALAAGYVRFWSELFAI